MVLKLKTSRKTVGYKQVKKALNFHKAEVVYVAMDAEERLRDEIIHLCMEKDVQVIQVKDMKKLGNACCIDVSAATAALLK